MTDETPKVDAAEIVSPVQHPMPLAVLATVSEIATRDGVSKQAVSKRVQALIDDHGLVVERNDRGHVAKVNVPHYDFLRQRHGDPSKDQRPPPPAEPTAPLVGDSYDEALRLKTHYEATRKGIELDVEIGKLIKVDEIAQAAADCGAEIAAIVGRLDNETDVLAAAGMRDGPHGLRVALKQIKNRMLGEIADALAALAQRGAVAGNEASAGT